MERCHEDHNLVGFFEGSGFRQPLLEVAGFVDINVHHRSFDNGDRRVGATPLFSSSIDILGQKHLPERKRRGLVRTPFLIRPILPKLCLNIIFRMIKSDASTVKELSGRCLTRDFMLPFICKSCQIPSRLTGRALIVGGTPASRMNC
jgi:hypothetical protein